MSDTTLAARWAAAQTAHAGQEEALAETALCQAAGLLRRAAGLLGCSRRALDQVLARRPDLGHLAARLRAPAGYRRGNPTFFGKARVAP